jgi:hypothetical protein
MEITSRVLYAWLPVIALVGLWIYFMGRIKATRRGEFGEVLDRLQHIEALLDRIAAGLERGAGR